MNKIFIFVIIVVLVVGGFFLLKPKETIEQNSTDDFKLTRETKTFDITAKQWEFNPAIIEVNLGDKVELHVESLDVTHGFVISEFGVSERLNPGEDVHVEFIASKTGVFNFFCNIPCGSGHGGMRGQLVVK